MVSPTLIPQLPEPLPPFPALSTTQDELGFFDRAKKYIGNRASYAEFMKLINLFTNDLIDKHILCDRVGSFLAGNPDLMRWFTDFLNIGEQEEIIEARSRPDPGRVNLSMCRSLGPSYRHLPKRDQHKPCKGRDAMCSEVLNDTWASHPTWASEDSGFIAHRKNQYEETMHRIEEERHDYDFHIEACQRTIQLMEPIVQQFKVMTEQDLVNFSLARGLGGASEAIPKRIIMKIYGREYGAKVMSDLFVNPTLVLPVLLDRLKKKLEEWKHAQREWERIWREQIHKNFWKSLDHQGINARNLDKKNFQPKTLTSEVQTKYEERKKARDGGQSRPKWQLEFFFKDEAVIKDALALAYCGVQLDVQSTENEKLAMTRFMEDFVSRSFDIDRDQLKVLLSEQDAENGEVEASGMLGENPSRNRRGGGDSMRRLLMERKIGRDGSVASGSRASTPAPTANAAEGSDEAAAQQLSELTLPGDAAESAQPSPSPEPWTKMANTTAILPRKSLIDEVQEHVTFNLYANANLYCFFRLFEMLYSRLLAIKQNEQGVHEAVYRWRGEDGDPKAAIELRMTDKGPDEFFEDVTPGTNFYAQVLRMCRQVLQGGLEMSHLEELLRRYYNESGWQLYAVERLVSAIVRSVSGMHNSESKDKSLVIADLFFKDRMKPDTTMAQEVAYRKQAQKFNKDGDVYRISFVSLLRASVMNGTNDDQVPASQCCTVRLFPPEDSSFDNDDLSATARYQYYMACYPMRETTEGVDLSRMQPPFLRRNLTKQDKDVDVEASYKEVYGNLQHFDDQEIIVNEDTYRMSFTPGQTYMFSRPSFSKKVYTEGKIEESEKFLDKLVRNSLWMKDQKSEDVEKRKAFWEKGLKEGVWVDQDAGQA
jgi:paired amphipathic helix protein Sin3a